MGDDARMMPEDLRVELAPDELRQPRGRALAAGSSERACANAASSRIDTVPKRRCTERYDAARPPESRASRGSGRCARESRGTAPCRRSCRVRRPAPRGWSGGSRSPRATGTGRGARPAAPRAPRRAGRSGGPADATASARPATRCCTA